MTAKKKSPPRNRKGELHVRDAVLVPRLKAYSEKMGRKLNTQAVMYIREGLDRDDVAQ